MFNITTKYFTNFDISRAYSILMFKALSLVLFERFKKLT